MQQTVERWNQGRWARVRAEVHSDPVDGSGQIVVISRDGSRQACRYHLPEEPQQIRDLVLALCEPPEQWKAQHRRDWGSVG